jgi:predicted RNase H-like HicB family nuclease
MYLKLIVNEFGGGYCAYTEELPGAISEGDTLDEARTNLRDAIHVLTRDLPAVARSQTSGQRVIREQISVPFA